MTYTLTPVPLGDTRGRCKIVPVEKEKKEKETRMCIQRPCKNIDNPEVPLFAASCCLSLLRASISCRPALCLSRDLLDFMGGWGCGLAEGRGVGGGCEEGSGGGSVRGH
jgi:hypothetical protein